MESDLWTVMREDEWWVKNRGDKLPYVSPYVRDLM